MRGARDQRVGNVGRCQRLVGAAVGEEAALAVRVDQRDEAPGRPLGVGHEMRGHARGLEARRLGLEVGRAEAGDEIDREPEMGEPRRLVGGRAAGLETDPRPPVRAARQRPLGADDDVRHHVADRQHAQTPIPPAIG